MEKKNSNEIKNLNVPIKKQLFIRTIKDDITKYYEIIKKLGEGSYGKIYLVLNKESNDIRAMKQIVKLKVNNLDTFKREVQILNMVDHPNIVRLFEIFEDENFFYLIMEYCSGGDLYNKLKEKNRSKLLFTEKEASIIIKQLASAIAYCHLKGICHRDLKLENILFSNLNHNSDIKVIDFGCSILRKSPSEKKSHMKMKVGTVFYISPEIIKGKYDEKCDVWACGIILFILLFGYQPFNGKTDKEIYENIISSNFEFPKKGEIYISKQVKELISNMICPENKRYTAKQVLQDKWILSNNKDEILPIPKVIDKLSLITYQNFNAFKKLVLIFIASRLTSSESQKIKELFFYLDSSQTGILNKEDFKRYLVSDENTKDMTEEEIKELFLGIDLDQNESIDYTEFLSAHMSKEIYFKEEKLKEAFNAFSRNDISIITKNEILRCFNLESNQNNIEFANKLLEINDFNHDGRIDYNDFIRMMDKE